LLLLNSFLRAYRRYGTISKIIQVGFTGNLTLEDIDIVRKLMASLENHLRSRNQLQPQVEQELKKVKEVVKLKAESSPTNP
jgi:hypothetical protein